jgi:DNA polymerase III subunit delta
MVAVKAHQAQAFLSAADQRHRVVLFFGSDAGLVAERAQIFAKAAAGRFNPPGELLRLDETDLDSEADRLTVELGTVPMFGGPKIVRVTAGRKINAAMLRPLLETPIEGMLIVEAANLKPDDSLRSLFEKSATAAAVACYSDGAQDLEGLIREVLREAKLTITPNARELLVGRLGADRALSRGEIEKLALFAQGKQEIDVEDVEAVVGDVSELALERVYNAAASGQTGRALAECVRAVSSGESAQAIIAATQWHFQRLHRVRAATERGVSLEDALRQMRPPMHFKQKDQFSAQCRIWTADRLNLALGRISAAAKAARISSALEDTLAERLMLGLAELARAGAARTK